MGPGESGHGPARRRSHPSPRTWARRMDSPGESGPLEQEGSSGQTPTKRETKPRTSPKRRTAPSFEYCKDRARPEPASCFPHSPGTERSVRQSGERAPRRKRARTGAELRQCRARAHRCQPWGPGGAGESWSGRRQGRPSAEENLRARAEMGSGVGSPSETLRVRWLLLVGLLSPALGGARSGGCPPPGTFRDSSFLGPGCSEFLPRGA